MNMIAPTRRPGRGLKTTLLSSALMAGVATSAIAQTATSADDSAVRLSPVTVTSQTDAGSGTRGFVATESQSATKTKTPLIATPGAISVVTVKQMDQQQAQSVSQALRYTSGVVSEPYGTDSRLDWIRIRGFDATEFGVFLDGLRFTPGYTGATYEPYDLERIDVLKGPSSVLYGQGTPGGLVNLVSKEPTATPHREFELSGGSYGRYQAQGDVSGPVEGTDGKWSYRLVGLVRKSDTQVDSTPDDRVFFAPSVTYRPNANDKITVLATIQHDNTAGLQFLPADGTVVASPYGRISTKLFTGEESDNYYKRTQASIGYEYEHRFDDTWSVQQSVRYNHFDLDWAQVYGTGVKADQRTLTRYGFGQQDSSDTVNVDNRVIGHLPVGPVDQTVLGGLDYSHVSYRESETGGTATSLDLYTPVYSGVQATHPLIYEANQESDQIGLYGQDQLRWGSWALTGGVRHDWLSESTNNILASSDSSQTDGATTGHVGLAYVSKLGLTPYVNYSRSFEPTYGINAAGGTFVPTTGVQYEAGVKYQPPAVNAFITGSVFDIRENNVLTTDPNNVLYQVQTGQIHVQGAEIEATATIARGWDMVASYTYMQPKISNANDGTEGNRPAAVPMNMASVWSDYTIHAGALKNFGFGGGLRYVGSAPGDNANSFSVPDHTLVDAAVHYDFAQYRVGINATNLADTTYVASCGSTASCFYGPRRTVIASLKVRW
jgi:iron complex outermembrane receptor protein